MNKQYCVISFNIQVDLHFANVIEAGS